ncbi:hypothetical protein C2869_07540 [Saccharobesus litoralis]|uniref:Uncharacterized protein n=1 Tax=Saccharobesus litoralis TaxID=2172099 RepID=A0A2S0VQ24_9ALTE|nr:hypothetical protein [Saccharobesus litoralis]AWB66293.1 hypothetical protein C2869_07540 [Saccharobesus litoralis]
MKLAHSLVALSIVASLGLAGCNSTGSDQQASVSGKKSLEQRIDDKTFPAVFQAWNPLDMEEKYPTTTHEQFLNNAAKHSLLWEEPVSQLGFNTKLVMGLVWDHKYAGLATSFTKESLAVAQANQAYLLNKNPNMVTLFEVRWRDAPGSYLPENSEYWLRDDKGNRVAGWTGGPEPYYMLNYKNEAFQKRLGEQAKAVIDSGIYDGVMLDWSGYLPIVKIVREYMGEDGLLTVNIHDEIDKGEKYKEYINGAFMECGPNGRMPNVEKKLCTWESMAKSLKFYEENLRKPTVNALEAWGERHDLQSMRAVTTLGLTHSDAYVLFADYNPIPTPDHMHDWYDFWDLDLGDPQGKGQEQQDGSYRRQFEKAVVYYNPEGNKTIELEFNLPHRSAATGKVGTEFTIPAQDGDVFYSL